MGLLLEVAAHTRSEHGLQIRTTFRHARISEEASEDLLFAFDERLGISALKAPQSFPLDAF